MKLSDFFSRNTQNIGNVNNSPSVSGDPYKQNRINQEIRGMKPGQTLQGEVVARNGNEVQIRLSDDAVLSARLEKSMEMEPGRVVTFEVKNNSNGLLAISPLFENMGTDANVLKALEMAGLPVNKASVAMTEAMMREGMSIDKNSLSSMYKQVMNFPESQPATIVELQKMGLEVTGETIRQLENYKNLEHQLIKDITNILDEISFQYESMMAAGDTEGASALYRELLTMLTGIDLAAAEMPEKGAVIIKDGAVGEMEQNLLQVSAEGEEALTEQSVSTVRTEAAGNAGTAETAQILSEGTQAEETAVSSNKAMDEALFALLGKEELSELAGRMRELGINENALAAWEQGTLTGKEALTEIAKALAQLPPGEKEHLSGQIFSSKGFQNLIRQNLTEQWLLTPDEVRDKEHVKALYERLDSQLAKLSETLSPNGKGDNPMAKSVANLRSNLDFMNQINQIYSYVQLPLKMNEGKAHGDLYVYANKKSLASKDGSISALLHLDMEHLGPVDVYVAMQEQRVTTHFYLPDETMLDFIEAHIHILNDRLEKKGYALNPVLSVKNEEKTAVEEMLGTGEDVSVLSQYSFDVRA